MSVILEPDVTGTGETLDGSRLAVELEFVLGPVRTDARLVKLVAVHTRDVFAVQLHGYLGSLATDLELIPLACGLTREAGRRHEVVDSAQRVLTYPAATGHLHFEARIDGILHVLDAEKDP